MNRTEFTDLAEFHQEIQRQQRKAHGKHYTDNHKALAKYGKQCPVQKELGVAQGGTLAALMLTNPKKLTGIDFKGNRFQPYQRYFVDYANQNGIHFEFYDRDSIDPTTVSDCDLLHIDSRHTATHLAQELKLHGDKVRKYIVCHDTQAIPAMITTLKQYISGKDWRVIEHHERNVGYTVIGR